jgi:hypothetical protein
MLKKLVSINSNFESFSLKKYFTYLTTLSLISASLVVSTLSLRASAKEATPQTTGSVEVALVENKASGNKVYELRDGKKTVKVEVTAEQIKQADELVKKQSKEVGANIGKPSFLPIAGGIAAAASFIAAWAQILFWDALIACGSNVVGCAAAITFIWNHGPDAFNRVRNFVRTRRW